MPLEPLKSVRDKLCTKVRKCSRDDAKTLDFVLDVLEKGRRLCNDPSLTAHDCNLWFLLYAISRHATEADVRTMQAYMTRVRREQIAAKCS